MGRLGLRMTRPPWPAADGQVERGAPQLVDRVGRDDDRETVALDDRVVLRHLRERLEGQVVLVVDADRAGDLDAQAERLGVGLAAADLQHLLDGAWRSPR